MWIKTTCEHRSCHDSRVCAVAMPLTSMKAMKAMRSMKRPGNEQRRRRLIKLGEFKVDAIADGRPHLANCMNELSKEYRARQSGATKRKHKATRPPVSSRLGASPKATAVRKLVAIDRAARPVARTVEQSSSGTSTSERVARPVGSSATSSSSPSKPTSAPRIGLTWPRVTLELGDYKPYPPV
jgi:hypothetical protein